MKPSLPFRLVFVSLLVLTFATSQAQVKFSYLGQYNTLGVPDNLEDTSDAIGQLFLNDINNALPETKPVPSFHPEYIAQKNETDIVLKASADIWITFVNEGAGYTNALGFYTYNPSNPPKTTADVKSHSIIFPNVSMEGSGGGLKRRNKVFLGSFDANTAIGWFVVADAFKGGKMTQGKYIVYSEPVLNPEKDATLKSHTVLLKDANRGKLVLGFEDVLRDQGSDQDFNDMTFFITASPYSAIKTDDVISIDGSGTGTTTTTTPPVTTTTPKDTMKPVKNNPDILVALPPNNTNNNTSSNTNNNTTNNNPNININTNVNNNGQNGTTGNGSTTNTTNTTNNVNTGTNTNTSTNSNNTTTNNNTNTNTSTNSNNNTTVINNTTIVNRTGGGGGGHHGGGNTNTNTNNNTNNNSNTNTNTNANTNTNVNTNTNGGGGNNNGTGNANTGGNGNNNGGTGTTNTTNTTVSNVTVCNRDGFALANFNTLKTTIKAQYVESNKPMVIKQAVKNKKVTVSQVKEIIKLIVVEQYKLDMAKYLFDFTCDKSNYYELNALLQASRARELDAYLQDKDMSDDNVTSVNTAVTNGSSSTNTQNTNTVQNNTNYTSSSNVLCDNGRMPYEEFDDIKSSINSKPFSDSKINILKEAMPSRCINSIQVKEVMGLFSFESDKMTVAKYLYKFTTDKQNYYKVNDGFTFASSIDELKAYLKTVK